MVNQANYIIKKNLTEKTKALKKKTSKHGHKLIRGK